MRKLTNPQTHKLANSELANSQTHKTNWQTHKPGRRDRDVRNTTENSENSWCDIHIMCSTLQTILSGPTNTCFKLHLQVEKMSFDIFQDSSLQFMTVHHSSRLHTGLSAQFLQQFCTEQRANKKACSKQKIKSIHHGDHFHPSICCPTILGAWPFCGLQKRQLEEVEGVV